MTNTAAQSSANASAQSSSSPASPLPLSSITVSLVAKFIAWLVGWYICIRFEFGSIYFVLSAILAIFNNLSNDATNTNAANRLSAYSVFNPGARRIAGSLNPEQMENEIRHRQGPRSSGIDLDLTEGTPAREHYQRKSKAANQPCVCGSGKKYKNCCSPLTASDSQIEREWEEYEREWMHTS